jgi:hypothetical protein
MKRNRFKAAGIVVLASLSLLACNENLPTGYEQLDTSITNAAGNTAENDVENAAENSATVDPTETTTTQTELNLDFLPNFTFESTGEELKFTLTNISDETAHITEFDIFVYYAETVGVPLRRIDVHYGTKGRRVTINYIDGKADMSDVEFWFNPMADDIPAEIVNLKPGESCSFELFEAYPDLSPVATDYLVGKTPRTVQFTFKGDGLDTSDEYQEKLLESIDTDIRFYHVALSGNGIVYSAYNEDDKRTPKLYLSDGKKSTLVSDESYGADYFCISPDGQAVIYYESDGQQKQFYYYRNGEATPVNGIEKPLALGDKGIIYYQRGNGLYVQVAGKADSELFLREFGEKVQFSGTFNADMTEYIYKKAVENGAVENDDESDESTVDIYYLKDGEKLTCAAENTGFTSDLLLLPQHTVKIYGDYYTDKIYYDIMGVDSFVGTYCTIIGDSILETGITIFGEDYKMHDVLTNVMHEDSYYYNDIKISDDGSVITLLYRGRVYRFDSRSPGKVESVTAANVMMFIPSEDGKSIYYFTNDKELYFVNTDGNEKLLMSDLTEINTNDYDNCYTFNNNEFLFIHDNTSLLYYDGSEISEHQPLGDDYHYASLSYDGKRFYIWGWDSDNHSSSYYLTEDFKVDDTM